MKWLVALLVAFAPSPVPAQGTDAEQAPKLGAVMEAVRGGQAQVALDRVEPILKAYEADLAAEKRRIYCGMSGAETIAYMGLAAGDKTGAIALAPGYCTALFLKGYALIDLNRIADARAIYERVVALAPMHAHFIVELGQSYRYERNWPKMLETCTSAQGYAEMANPDEVKTAKGMAWRCMGYALTEQGKLDEAEALYRKCVDLNPDDTIARHELDYLAEQRGKHK